MRPAEIILLVFALFLLVRGLIGVVRQQIRVGGYARIPPLQGPAALIVSLLGMAFGSMVAVDVLVGPGLGSIQGVLSTVGVIGALLAETWAVTAANRQRRE